MLECKLGKHITSSNLNVWPLVLGPSSLTAKLSLYLLTRMIYLKFFFRVNQLKRKEKNCLVTVWTVMGGFCKSIKYKTLF